MTGSRLSLAGTLFLALVIGAPLFAQAHFTRSDANFDGQTDLSDGVRILNWLFIGGVEPPCLDAADTNDDGAVDLSDASGIFNFLFLGGRAPAQPYPNFEKDPTDNDDLPCMGPVVDLSGDITANRALERGKVYRLISGVFIKDGATLTIPAGVTIIGDSASKGLLVAERGAKLIANGTRTQPVVFTSEKPVGQRGRGDWGGVILLGRGDNNLPGKEGEAEGLQGQRYGGAGNVIADDSSGKLSYVRIEFGGTEISPDNEVNSLSVFASGSGTEFDHVMCKFNLDDGFEWFGGAANLKYGIAFGIRDDSFDYSFAWAGKGQFWVAQQRGDDADKGFEVDNNEDEFEATPLTSPTIANITILGDPDNNEGPESVTGLHIRRGAGSKIYNAIVGGFKSCGLDVDDAPTFKNNPTNGNFIIDYSIFFQNGPNGTRHACDGDDGATLPDPHFTADDFLRVMNTHNDFPEASPVVAPFDLVNPDYRPVNASAVTSGFDANTLDPWFTRAQYKGAIDPTAVDDWTKEPWTSYLQN
jgi:hypothetical protein